jgi:hypothetical protein
MRHVLAVTVVAAITAFGADAASARHADSANPFTTDASHRALIHFVPLDARARGLLRGAVPVVKKWMLLPTEITEVVTSKPNWMNRTRRQMNALVVMNDMLARYRRAQGVRPGLIIPVTSQSLYSPRVPAYRFVFGMNQVSGQQAAAIIGTAQMRVFHPEREKARLSKMILRYFGEIICGLPRNGNPRSVLYDPLLSDADLDHMVARLPRRC